MLARSIQSVVGLTNVKQMCALTYKNSFFREESFESIRVEHFTVLVKLISAVTSKISLVLKSCWVEYQINGTQCMRKRCFTRGPK